MKNRDDLLLMVLVLGIISVPIILKVFYKPKNTNLQTTSNQTSTLVRQPAVAGSFYPANPVELTAQLTNFLNNAASIDAPGQLRILIVPHAGTVFSGQTAAWGFKQIKNQNYSRVILLGASHHAWFDHAAVYNLGSWETPLGKVAIDENLAAALLDKKQKITADLSPHQQEHSLEVELIFLQQILDRFTIVPILLSQPSDQLIEDLAQKISLYSDDQTLLVVSSDLAHYPTWETANEVDSQTIEAILTGKKEFFDQTITRLETAGYPALETAACGRQAIRVGLRVSEILGLKDWQKIKYENSGGVAGDKTRVVGYAAVGAWGKAVNPLSLLINQEAQQEALQLARETLTTFLATNKIPSFTPKSPVLNQPLGAFVTLRKKGDLRGCIGEFEPQDPLYQVIQAKAVDAAVHDPRFSPVTPDEVSDLTIEISVLSPRQKIQNWQEISLGKHGVVIQKGQRSGTFLPQVATETGWTLDEFLGQLCSQKAGLPSDCYQDPSVNLFVFEAFVFPESKRVNN